MLHVTRDKASLVFGVMEEQRVGIKFRVKAGKSAVETIELINKAYGSAAMSRAIVYRWYASFRDGREDVCIFFLLLVKGTLIF